MSLDTNMETGQEGRQEEMEAAAEKFDRFMGLADHIGARKFVSGLDEQTKKYIAQHPKYGWRYNAAFRATF